MHISQRFICYKYLFIKVSKCLETEREKMKLKKASTCLRCYSDMIQSEKLFQIQLQNNSSATHLDVPVSYSTAHYMHAED